MKKILIVEDDRLIAELERDYLEASEYEVELAMDGFAGMKLVREQEYDLVILDVMLPGVSGFEICREIRKTKDIPVLLVTAKKEDVDKIRGLGLGADDYIVKPFSPAELVARVKAHIGIHERLLKKGRQKEAYEKIIEVRNLRIDLSSSRSRIPFSGTSLRNRIFFFSASTL